MKRIAPDKWRHFFAGIALGALLQGGLWYLFPAHPVAVTLAVLALVAAISYGFELFSLLTGRGYHDLLDAVASMIGGVLGMGAVLVWMAV
jgi:glycopeptide antibiotics resistance protein